MRDGDGGGAGAGRQVRSAGTGAGAGRMVAGVAVGASPVKIMQEAHHPSSSAGEDGTARGARRGERGAGSVARGLTNAGAGAGRGSAA